MTDRPGDPARISVRRLARRDLPEAAKLLAAVYREPPYRERWTRGAALNYLSGIAGLDPAACFAAHTQGELAGVLIGYGYVFRGVTVYFIQELFVGVRWRGKGAARSLLRRAAARHRGRRVFSLFARRDAPAMRFYRRLGFKQHSKYKFCYVRLPRGRWPAGQARPGGN